MNWEHLRAFLWLHSRLRANKSKRASNLSNTLHVLLQIAGVLIAVVAFGASMAAGVYALGNAKPFVLLAAWDVLVGVFLFVWLMALLTDLQRSELMPIEKFMQYPISVSGLFLINYVSSIFSEHIAMVLFIPAMFGLSVGLVVSRGAAMLWQIPLLLAFILMVTAVTYQFRGWLAVVMLNKRHRRTVITVVTLVTMLLFQLPYLSRFVLGKRGINHDVVMVASNRDRIQQTVTMVSMALPMGWLPYGAMASAEGRYLPPLFGIAGMSLIGAFSLRRSYRTTMRLYTGNFGSGRTRSVAATVLPARTQSAAARSMLDIEIPWVSEQASIVALTTFRSFTRAPESKMVLLSPLMLVFFFGASVARWSSSPAEFARPLIASGVLMGILFSTSQLAANQFAFDRSGFRNYVLASAPRRDILLGKNLALVPVTLGLASLAVIVMQWAFPMRIDHFIAVLFQMVTMFFLVCMFSNFLSIVNPMAIASGSLRPAVRPSGKTLLFSLLTLVLFPLAMAPSMIPLGLEYGAHWMGWYPGLPIFLLLSIMEVLSVAYLYSWILDREGKFLQSRELEILDVVARNAGTE